MASYCSCSPLPSVLLVNRPYEFPGSRLASCRFSPFGLPAFHLFRHDETREHNVGASDITFLDLIGSHPFREGTQHDYFLLSTQRPWHRSVLPEDVCFHSLNIDHQTK